MSSKNTPIPMSARASGPLTGTALSPGNKSISHRALLLGALAVGETVIEGLLESEDVYATAGAMRAMGAQIEKRGLTWHVHGVGVGGLRAPAAPLDMGNSGTSMRLLAGLVATHPITAEFFGDASLSRRPMGRVIEPLSQMGAVFEATDSRLPIKIMGARRPMPITYTLPVASAQVKSAILLAGLNTPGTTTVIEPVATRDHTELMLRAAGAALEVEDLGPAGKTIRITGYAELQPQRIRVPSDPSSTAFPMVAALIVPGSDIFLPGVGINPTRAGLFTTLTDMGARLEISNEREEGGEGAADIRVIHGDLHGIDVPAGRAPSMIDEYPILAVAAAYARGTTRMRGLHELRTKESDRLTIMAEGLAACGVRTEIEGDDLIVHGTGRVAGGAEMATHLDHRIAMSFLVAGLAAEQPIRIDDAVPIHTSFPGFVALMQALGAQIASS